MAHILAKIRKQAEFAEHERATSLPQNKQLARTLRPPYAERRREDPSVEIARLQFGTK